MSNSFSAGLLRSLEDAAHERDVAILASSLDEEAQRERNLVSSLVRRRVDGLVLMPATHRQDYLAEELRAVCPSSSSTAAARRRRRLGDRRQPSWCRLRRPLTSSDMATSGSPTSATSTRSRRHRHAWPATGRPTVTPGPRRTPRLEVQGLRSSEAAGDAVERLLDLDLPADSLLRGTQLPRDRHRAGAAGAGSSP